MMQSSLDNNNNMQHVENYHQQQLLLLHHKKRAVVPGNGTTGAADMNSQVEVFATRLKGSSSTNDKIVVIPRENIIQWPSQDAVFAAQRKNKAAGSSMGNNNNNNNTTMLKMELCPQFDASSAETAATSCPRGERCPFVHAFLDASTVARDIHVNYAWRSADDCTFERFEAGSVLHVAPPNEYVVRDAIPSHLVLKTKVFESNRRVLSHCAHYYFNRTCNRGPDCFFIHALSMAAPSHGAAAATTAATPATSKPSSSDDDCATDGSTPTESINCGAAELAEMLAQAQAAGLHTPCSFGRTQPVPGCPPQLSGRKKCNRGSVLCPSLETSVAPSVAPSAAPSAPASVASPSLQRVSVKDVAMAGSVSPGTAYLGSRKDSLLGTPGFMALNSGSVSSSYGMNHSGSFNNNYNTSNSNNNSNANAMSSVPPPPSYNASVQAVSIMSMPLSVSAPHLMSSVLSMPISSSDSMPVSPLRGGGFPAYHHQPQQQQQPLPPPPPFGAEHEYSYAATQYARTTPHHFSSYEQPPMMMTTQQEQMSAMMMIIPAPLSQQQQQQQQQHYNKTQSSRRAAAGALATAFRLGDSDADDEERLADKGGVIFYSKIDNTCYAQQEQYGESCEQMETVQMTVEPESPKSAPRRRQNNPYSMTKPVIIC